MNVLNLGTNGLVVSSIKSVVVGRCDKPNSVLKFLGVGC